MAEDWAAVSRAINDRLAERTMTQSQLVDTSGLSKRTVYEIVHDTVRRNRSELTLMALSEALGWHAGHLRAILHGEPPPVPGTPALRSEKDVSGRLTVMEHELRLINDRLTKIDAKNNRLDDIATDIRAAVQRIADSLADPGR